MCNKISSDSVNIRGKMTMGALLHEVKQKVAFQDDIIEVAFQTTVTERNYLMHRFFLDRS